MRVTFHPILRSPSPLTPVAFPMFFLIPSVLMAFQTGSSVFLSFDVISSCFRLHFPRPIIMTSFLNAPQESYRESMEYEV